GGVDALVLVARVAAGSGHVDLARTVVRVRRLQVGITGGRDRHHAGQFGRNVQAGVGDRPVGDRRRVVRAGAVRGLVCQVVVRVARRGHAQHALIARVLHRTLHAFQDGGLILVVRAGELPRVDVVAVVGDVELLVTGEHERADGVLREEQAGGFLGDAHRRDLHPRRHTDDTLAVLGRRDRARHVRAVRAGVPPRALAVVQLAVGARGGLARVEVVLQLRVLVVHAGVQHADRDVRRTGGDLPRLVRADLFHVPLHRLVLAGLLLRGSLRDLRVVGLLGDIRGARGADGLHPGGPAYGVGE